MEDFKLTPERQKIASEVIGRQLRVAKLLEKNFNSWVKIPGDEASTIGFEVQKQILKIIDTLLWLKDNPKAEKIRYVVTLPNKDAMLYNMINENNRLRAEIKDLNVQLNYGLQNG